jgi:hypothetical protein
VDRSACRRQPDPDADRPQRLAERHADSDGAAHERADAAAYRDANGDARAFSYLIRGRRPSRRHAAAG